MTLQTWILLGVIAAFGALSGYAVMENGYLGIFTYHFHSSAGWQVLVDLILVCALAMIWMVHNARATGRTAWPYVLITLLAGGFGPLLYLLVGSLRASASAPIQHG